MGRMLSMNMAKIRLAHTVSFVQRMIDFSL
jgi:hypothetical protein